MYKSLSYRVPLSLVEDCSDFQDQLRYGPTLQVNSNFYVLYSTVHHDQFLTSKDICQCEPPAWGHLKAMPASSLP